MVVSVIKIEQIEVDSADGTIRDSDFAPAIQGSVRDSSASRSSDLLFTHLPQVTNPVANNVLDGWDTEDKEDWSDSPTRKPLLLYRHRFGWGRDKAEVFSGLPLGDEGQRWGNLDDDSGLLIYEELFSLSSSTVVRSIQTQASATIRDFSFAVENNLTNIRHLEEVSGEADIEQFPFLITALPEPFSEKNPVNTDVFIRLSNHAFPLASGTITLYLDNVERNITLTEFFSGLGGFDVDWTNDFIFDYDAQVNVRVEFSDTDSPPNDFVIRYPFFTVPDLAGPRIRNLVPDNNVSSVSTDGPLQFDVVDFEKGVDVDSLILYVNNVEIINGVHGSIETTEITDGYTIKYTPNEPWAYGDLVPVAIFIKDASINKNETFFTYSFTTTESSAPRLLNLDPDACSINVPVGKNIEFTVIGGGHGFNKKSLVFTVEGVNKSNLVAEPIIHRDE